MLFYPGDLVTCTGDRVNYAEHEKFGRVGSDFFCLFCLLYGMKKRMYRLYSTGVYWRFLYNQ